MFSVGFSDLAVSASESDFQERLVSEMTSGVWVGCWTLLCHLFV